MPTIRNQVFNAFTLTAAKATQGTNPSGRSSCLYLPEHHADFADWTEWQFVFHAIAGTAPSALAVTATWERRVINNPLTDGSVPEEEYHPAGTLPTYQTISTALNPELLAGDDWPTKILDYPTDTLAAPKIVSNRILAGFRHRVRLGLTITGGDATTGIILSCTTVMKGS